MHESYTRVVPSRIFVTFTCIENVFHCSYQENDFYQSFGIQSIFCNYFQKIGGFVRKKILWAAFIPTKSVQLITPHHITQSKILDVKEKKKENGLILLKTFNARICSLSLSIQMCVCVCLCDTQRHIHTRGNFFFFYGRWGKF